ncbi:MAG: hypothetical protein H7Y22_09960 [Gemmatimonadaceae bacterium]|nr:hypothetical protein [Gloeobacterales cyanobacterium ES-bin-141]
MTPSMDGCDLDALFALYEELGCGRRLLIWGNKGCGKTSALLALGNRVASYALTTLPGSTIAVPLVLHLAHRDPHNPATAKWSVDSDFLHWLSRLAEHRYSLSRGYLVEALSLNQVSLLLDGLDEVPPQQRLHCLNALDRFRREQFPNVKIIVCCRKQLKLVLPALAEDIFSEAITLAVPTPEQVDSYLSAVDGYKALRSVVSSNAIYRGLATELLMLRLMMEVYKDAQSVQLPQSLSPEECRSRLWNAYLEHARVQRRGPWRGTGVALVQDKLNDPRQWDDAIRKLAWLGSKMVEFHNFFAEDVQPSWLSVKQLCLYHLLTTASVLLLFSPLYLWISGGKLELLALGFVFTLLLVGHGCFSLLVVSSGRTARQIRRLLRKLPCYASYMRYSRNLSRAIRHPVAPVVGWDFVPRRGLEAVYRSWKSATTLSIAFGFTIGVFAALMETAGVALCVGVLTAIGIWGA